MLLDREKRELSLKLVYDGPALSGKTTNLQKLHARAAAHSRGRLVALDPQADLLPLHVSAGGMVVKIRVYTVPGQPILNATRKVVLKDADGVAFIADARAEETETNHEAFLQLKENLREQGADPEATPLVLQYNKRDLPGARAEAELAKLSTPARPVLSACALRDQGVLKTFIALLSLTWDALAKRQELEVPRAELLEKVAALFGKLM